MGDFPGHPFRGNQYGQGGAQGAHDKVVHPDRTMHVETVASERFVSPQTGHTAQLPAPMVVTEPPRETDQERRDSGRALLEDHARSARESRDREIMKGVERGDFHGKSAAEYEKNRAAAGVRAAAMNKGFGGYRKA